MNLLTLFNLLIIFDISLSEIVSTNVDINREYIGATSLDNHSLVFFAGGLARFATGVDVNHKGVDIYNLKTNQWSTAHLSFGRYEVVATSLKTKGLAFFAGGAYIDGGDLTKNPILCNNVDIYNANTNSWTTSALSVNRSGIAATSLDKQNLVFFAGGYITVNLGYPEFTTNIIDIYNATSNTWTTSTLFIKNMYVMATSLPSYGLAFMGGGFQKKLNLYNANTNSWSIRELSLEVSYAASCSLDAFGLSFFGGGSTQSSIISNIVDLYDAKTDTWSKLYFSSVRAGLTCSSLDKHGLVFFAGGGDSQSQFNTVEIYNANTGSWTISYLNARKANVASASLSDFAFFGGGFSSIDTVSGIDIFGSCTRGISQINSNSCLGCPAGYFCNYQITPIICPIGTYCGVNVSKVDSCPAGTYNDVLGKSSINDCKKCPPGTYNGNLGVGALSGCLTCQFGTYCKEGSIVSQACPENNYCPNPSVKTPCPAGTYLDETFAIAASSCKKCFKGHFCNGKGGSPIPCSPGTYSKIEGQNECETCPGGNACPFGATEPLICEMNYVSKKGSSACTACPSGAYTTGEGSTDCISCAGGQFDVSGWWCMSTFEKILFISVWVGTALSIYATIKNIYGFVISRLRKIKDAGLSFTFKRFIFADRLHYNVEISMPKKANTDFAVEIPLEQRLDYPYQNRQDIYQERRQDSPYRRERLAISANRTYDYLVEPQTKKYSSQLIEASKKIHEEKRNFWCPRLVGNSTNVDLNIYSNNDGDKNHSVEESVVKNKESVVKNKESIVKTTDKEIRRPPSENWNKSRGRSNIRINRTIRQQTSVESIARQMQAERKGTTKLDVV